MTMLSVRVHCLNLQEKPKKSVFMSRKWLNRMCNEITLLQMHGVTRLMQLIQLPVGPLGSLRSSKVDKEYIKEL
jgi:hypothetical protein